ncbi:MAG TPA: biopolymer transporter ExbD [Schlesneria sp.]|jgi:biopolymer transport protein ExbD
MPLKMAPLEEPAINMTSLLDIILFLVMFFMIGAHFSENEQTTDIQIPSAMAATTLSGAPDAIVVNVATDGQMTVKGETQTQDGLMQLLTTARTQFPGQSVVIRGDGRCQYQQVMDALSICTEAGIHNVSVAHLPRKPN